MLLPYDRSPRRLVVLVPMLAGFVFSTSSMSEGFAREASLKERFLAEAKKKCEEYEQFARRLQGTLIMKVVFQDKKSGKERPETGRFELKQNTRCASLALEFETPTEKSKELSAANPDYYFMLKGANTGSDWIVTTIDAPDAHPQINRPLHEKVLVRVMPQFYLQDRYSLAGMVESPDFVIERAEPVPSNGRIMARITFRYQQGKKLGDRDYIPVQGGTMLLDPDHQLVRSRTDLELQMG